jgi:hypothetical protein
VRTSRLRLMRLRRMTAFQAMGRASVQSASKTNHPHGKSTSGKNSKQTFRESSAEKSAHRARHQIIAFHSNSQECEAASKSCGESLMILRCALQRITW